MYIVPIGYVRIKLGLFPLPPPSPPPPSSSQDGGGGKERERRRRRRRRRYRFVVGAKPIYVAIKAGGGGRRGSFRQPANSTKNWAKLRNSNLLLSHSSSL